MFTQSYYWSIIKRQLRLAQVFALYFPNITFNTILLFTFKSTKWYPVRVLFFSDENFVGLVPVHFLHVPFGQSFSI
jgi:hypothetical protein